ncbi:hypothetical protein Chor_016282, partial [Crotalus horridus]
MGGFGLDGNLLSSILHNILISTRSQEPLVSLSPAQEKIVIESHWFVWVTQMNHIPMTIDYDKNMDWLSMQLQATCNVNQSLFNDWFTGHLNFQIEH